MREVLVSNARGNSNERPWETPHAPYSFVHQKQIFVIIIISSDDNVYWYNNYYIMILQMHG